MNENLPPNFYINVEYIHVNKIVGRRRTYMVRNAVTHTANQGL